MWAEPAAYAENDIFRKYFERLIAGCHAALNSTLWTPDRSVVCLACHKS